MHSIGQELKIFFAAPSGQQRSQNPHGRSTFAMISADGVPGHDMGKGLPVLSARQLFGAATTALSLIAGAFLLALAAENARAQGSASECDAAGEIALLPSPWAPWKGAPLRVMLVTEKPLQGELSLTGPDGSVAATSRERHGGPPYFWFTEVKAPAAGSWHATLTPQQGAGCGPIKREIKVRPDKPGGPGSAAGSTWPLRNTWNRASENLFSAWIEKLFDDPLDAEPSWPALHEVVRDPSRNFLFNHLGLNEDAKIYLRPDCADLPYTLRAYFAYKMGLPYGFSKCSRGGGGRAPTCPQWFSLQNAEAARPPPLPPVAAPIPPAGSGYFGVSSAPAPLAPPAPQRTGPAPSFAELVQIVSDSVHSASGRTALADNNTDYYPVPLSADTLRPGTTYADPYGHILMIVRRVAQTEDAAGIILAVDGQPDGTVARKRFWRGNFLFAQDPALGGPGFKRFRPVVVVNGAMRRLNNAEIEKNPQYADFSLDQSRLGVEDFYDRMDDVTSPSPLDPTRAMKEAITSLEEQVKVRVTSVENGRKFQNSKRGEAAMPDGPAIFETSGAWEDFSTPSRDLRLLIAIDVVLGFPDRVARRPERYAMPRDKSVAEVKAELQRVLASELATRKFSYPRSDGSAWTLTLRDVIDRAVALEIAYNPNDCVELRWGAPAKSDEAATCKRYAPAAQREKMSKYRAWFHERRRPPRA